MIFFHVSTTIIFMFKRAIFKLLIITRPYFLTYVIWISCMHGLINNLKPRPESKSKTVTATIPYWTCDHMSSTGFYVMMNEDRQLRLDLMTYFFVFGVYVLC